MREYEIIFYNILGEETYCWNRDIEYITDKIYQDYMGVFNDISFIVSEREKTDILRIKIKGCTKNYLLMYELDKNIKSLANEINQIRKMIREA